jgi:16S rRNA pseudouridine516 synthase
MKKIYEVIVDKPLEPRLIKLFADGSLVLQGEDKACLPAELIILDDLHARLTLNEGRYHQVRRMFASQGWEVTALHRSHFGEYSLGDLEAGKWRLIPLPGSI